MVGKGKSRIRVGLFGIAIFVMLFKGSECMKCLRCDGVIQPRHCHVITDCEQGEDCFVDRYEGERGETLYNLGCRTTSMCLNRKRHLKLPRMSQKRRSSVTCTECCNRNDICNSQGCGAPGYPMSRGPVCYSCTQTTDPAICDTIRVCEVNEFCSVEEEREFGDTFYTTGCASKHICDMKNQLAPVVGKRDVGMKRYLKCNQCCLGDFCNEACGNMTSFGSTIPPITHSGGTSTSIVSSIKPNTNAGHAAHQYILMFLPNFKIDPDLFEFIVTSTSPDASVNIDFGGSVGLSTKSIVNHTLSYAFSGSIASNPNVAESKGISINSTKPISVNAFSYLGNSGSAEAFHALPLNTLGYEYKTISFIPKHYNGNNDRSIIGIVTSKPNTNFSITLSTTTTIGSRSYATGETYRGVIPAKLGTFSIESSNDLSGSYVRSDAPVGVLSGNKCNPFGGGGCNHMIEYIPPIKSWGKTFVIPAIMSATGFEFDLIPAKANTNVTLTSETGSRSTFNVDTKRTFPNQLHDLIHVLEADSPILVSMYAFDSSGKSFMTLVPSIDKFSNNYIVATPSNSSFDNYLTIIVDSKFSDQILYDNKTLTSLNIQPKHLTTVLGVTWHVFTMPIDKNPHSVRHPSASVKFGLIQYGFKYGRSYAFPVGMEP